MSSHAAWAARYGGPIVTTHILKAIAVLAVLTIASMSAEAGTVQLMIRGGRVWLITKDASTREVLAEWQRVGQTEIVNGERLTGGPLTIQLAEVPEQQALDMVLRSAAGRRCGAIASSIRWATPRGVT